jgi:response regulator NasT
MFTAIIVDDEPITRTDFAEILQENGYSVVGQGSDGFDAIELCRNYKPDLVLMDIKMPIFDGLTAAESILKEKLTKCIILLTAHCDKEFVKKAKEIGIAGYLVKPVDEHTLISTVEVALSQCERYDSIVEELQGIKEKLEEKSLIDQAKLIISKQEGITEGEAFRLIQKMSMDKQTTMASISRLIVENGSERSKLEKAKKYLMDKYRIDETTAYNKIKSYGKENKCSIAEASDIIISKYGI